MSYRNSRQVKGKVLDFSLAIDELCSTLDQLADCFMVTDREGRIVYVNAPFERATGYNCEELIGNTPRLLKSGAHPPQVYQELWQNLLQGKPFRFIFTNRKKSGELYEEGVMISPISGPSGEITHFVSLGRVIDQFRQTYDVFTLLANTSPNPIYVLRDGRFFFLNTEFQRLLGYSSEDLLGKDRSALVHPDDREIVVASASLLAQGREPPPLEYRVIDRAGDVKWVLEIIREAEFRGIQSVAGRFVTGSLVDITVRKRVEQDLKEAVSLYAATIESTADGIAITDLSGEIVGSNRRFREMWDLETTAFRLPRLSEVIPSIESRLKDPDASLGRIRQLLADPERESFERLELGDGRILELYSKPQTVEGVASGRVWSFRDITEREQFESALDYLASYDSLTGLMNRRRFREELEEQLERAKRGEARGAVLFMDIDDFKAVNDNLGHTAGDRFLRSLAERLGQAIQPDDVLARLGGDEFGLLLKDADRSKALAAAQALLHAAKGLKVIIEQRPVACTLSIGGALYPGSGESIDELLSRADTAMYRVKQSQRDSVLIAGGNDRKRPRLSGPRVRWQENLSTALADGRFRLLGQAIVRLADGAVAGKELLLRLQDGSRLVLPRAFLNQAVAKDFLPELERWVIGEALRLASTSQAGETRSLSVNLTSFANRHILDLLERAAERPDFRAGDICIEVSEEAVVSDMAPARRFLREVKALGYRVALDDFGAGFSSLAGLKKLPLDYLKIDGRFIRGLAGNRGNQHFVRGIAEVAAGLNLELIAEHVGDDETVSILLEAGVAYGQGFHFGKPAPLNGRAEATRIAA